MGDKFRDDRAARAPIRLVLVCLSAGGPGGLRTMHTSRYQARNQPFARARDLIFSHGVLHVLFIKRQTSPTTPSQVLLHRICSATSALNF